MTLLQIKIQTIICLFLCIVYQSWITQLHSIQMCYMWSRGLSKGWCWVLTCSHKLAEYHCVASEGHVLCKGTPILTNHLPIKCICSVTQLHVHLCQSIKPVCIPLVAPCTIPMLLNCSNVTVQSCSPLQLLCVFCPLIHCKKDLLFLIIVFLTRITTVDIVLWDDTIK